MCEGDFLIFWPLGDFGDNKENYELGEMLGVDETVEDREEVEVETVPVEVEVPVYILNPCKFMSSKFC